MSRNEKNPTAPGIYRGLTAIFTDCETGETDAWSQYPAKKARVLNQNRALRWVSACVFRRFPVQRWPATFARFHGLNVPRLGKLPPGSRIRPPTSSAIIFRFLNQT